ncbi:type II RES/Xre toxin-antitoxin system antitoxin [Niabella aquatica]
MKSRKNTHHYTNEEEILPVMEEAAVAYNVANKNITGPLALLGIHNNSQGLYNTADFITYIRTGVPKKALDHLAGEIDLSAAEVAAIIHTSERTLRRYTPSQKLNADQSERVLELARLYARGAEVFENMESFKLWMESPVGALGNKKPKSFLDTSMGIALLIEELGRIEHGIFA